MAVCMGDWLSLLSGVADGASVSMWQYVWDVWEARALGTVSGCSGAYIDVSSNDM